MPRPGLGESYSQFANVAPPVLLDLPQPRLSNLWLVDPQLAADLVEAVFAGAHPCRPEYFPQRFTRPIR